MKRLENKMFWKNWPSWLKWGIIGIIFYIIMLPLGYYGIFAIVAINTPIRYIHELFNIYISLNGIDSFYSLKGILYHGISTIITFTILGFIAGLIKKILESKKQPQQLNQNLPKK